MLPLLWPKALTLIYTINLCLSLLRHGKADVSIALLIWLKRSLEKSPKGFGADSPKYGWVGSGGGRERTKVWAIRPGRRSQTDDGAGEEISNAGGCVHRLDTYLLKRNALSRLCPAVHGTIIKNGHNLFDKGGLGI